MLISKLQEEMIGAFYLKNDIKSLLIDTISNSLRSAKI